MEAASARYAGGYRARDRFGVLNETANSVLQRYIYNACDPQNMEPNLAVNLEVADLVNSKKGNAPREAAMTLVQIINSRNPNVSLLALALLDICVKNCGYPFHLQIGSKEFLNELVRRFPEKPPMRPSRVQSRILESIEEWRQTICQTSRYKEDLGFIRDMHRLLLYKGYMFPEVRREDAAVLNPSDNLKSAEEMEQEEQAAHSAKLQELIRRGGPEDLQEANRLMKVMAGYDTRHKTDYRAKAAEEVAKIQEKAKILEQMLQSYKTEDTIGEGDVFEELASALQSAHPKIQKMCEEDSEDSEAVAKLLEINDSIHRTVERYKLIKKGDAEGAAKIPKGTLGTSTGVGKNAANELSLIDFDPDTATGEGLEQDCARSKQAPLENDLLGLSMDDQPSQNQGSIALGMGESLSISGATSMPSMMRSKDTVAVSQQLQQPAQPNPAQPEYQAFSRSSSSSALPTQHSTTPSTQLPQTSNREPNASDPFALLVTGSARSQSPTNRTPAAKPAPQPSSLLDAVTPPQSAVPARENGSATDDEWTFASSLPRNSLPSSNQIDVLSSSIKITFLATRELGQPVVRIVVDFSNNTSQHIQGVHFQVAVKKGYNLHVNPQSGRDLGPNQIQGIQQELVLSGVAPGTAQSVEMRFKVSYQIDKEVRDEQGQVPPLGIA